MYHLFLVLLFIICWKQSHSESSALPSYNGGVGDIQIIRPEPTTNTTVFEPSSTPYRLFQVRTSIVDSTLPPKPLLIASPTAKGVYPVILFCHGFMVRNEFYSVILSHIASHGYIVVAPQFYGMIAISGPQEIEAAAEVTDWMSLHLQSKLPRDVEANLLKLSLVGHSRGGKAALALALGHAKTKLSYSLLVGIDPVAGPNANSETRPAILTREPESFNLSMPATVIGTGLGPEKLNFFTPPCAPEGVNHNEFYYESKPSKSHFVTKDYGHGDMLDDAAGLVEWMSGQMCKSGKGPKDLMRRTVGGIVVAFLNKYLKGKFGDVDNILANPGIAPAKIEPFEYVPAAASKTSL